MAGLSIRNGPVENGEMDVDSTATNGSKRKSRGSLMKSYKEESESDGEPLVGDALLHDDDKDTREARSANGIGM
jgi:hypothetical protein